MATNPHLARLDAIEATVAEIQKNDTTNDLRIELEQLQEIVGQHKDILVRLNNDRIADDDATPLWTERVNLDSTVKDGYRVKEATVTVANAKGDDATREERRRRLAELIQDGQAVADAMNSQRDQVKQFA
jgi:hypothetical protein